MKAAIIPSDDERRMMAITERVVSCFSVAGIIFIILTYTFSLHFRRPINRLVFFASFGNLGMNIAALIAEAGPSSGRTSSLCQFQAFMVQMFLGVDAYWSLCMALNVYLIFFSHFTTKKLRRLDLRYLVACYGLAFIPALIFTFVNPSDPRGRIYGDAVLWCWVSEGWGVLRIALVYSISWLAIAMALAVYTMAAIDTYKRRAELQPGFINPFNEAPLKPVITTDIQVTTELRTKLPSKGADPARVELGGYNPYTVDVAVGRQDENPEQRPGLMQMRTLTRNAANYHSNTDAILYARAALFYFVALLIIWVPASINRAYAVAHPEQMNFPLNYLSGLLLSAQGFLNVLVYIMTSQKAVTELWRGFKAGNRRGSIVEIHDGFGSRSEAQRLDSYCEP